MVRARPRGREPCKSSTRSRSRQVAGSRGNVVAEARCSHCAANANPIFLAPAVLCLRPSPRQLWYSSAPTTAGCRRYWYRSTVYGRTSSLRRDRVAFRPCSAGLLALHLLSTCSPLPAHLRPAPPPAILLTTTHGAAIPRPACPRCAPRQTRACAWTSSRLGPGTSAAHRRCLAAIAAPASHPARR